MKRDMNLVRAILLALERTTTGDDDGWPVLDLPERETAEIDHHAHIMHEAGLIEALHAPDHVRDRWIPIRLTWEGHDFLDAARDENRWTAAVKKIGGATASVSFTVLKEVLVALTRAQIGV